MSLMTNCIEHLQSPGLRDLWSLCAVEQASKEGFYEDKKG